MTKLSDAPGCIGSHVIRASRHPLCESCNFRTTCEKMAAIAKRRLAAELRVEPETLNAPPPRPVRHAPDPARVVAHRGEPLSLKAGLLKLKLERAGISPDTIADLDDARIEELAQGHLAVCLRLARAGVNDAAQMTAAIERELGIEPKAASAHATTFINVMSRLDVAQARAA